MKVSDYIANYLSKKKVKKVFSITGGASIHLIHSFAEIKNIDYVTMHHEQSCAMAADGYSRASDKLGVAAATSGPGATNLITGIACAWFDSIPTLFITGQVTRFRMKGKLKVRQIGFQETDIISMVKTITKYRTQIMNKRDLHYELDKCIHYAYEGRPGPVLIDIPDDVQRSMLDKKDLTYFKKNTFRPKIKSNKTIIHNNKINKLMEFLNNSRRPILIVGHGVRLSSSINLMKKIQNKLQIPYISTWAMLDIWSSFDRRNCGSFGTHGSRYGNFAVQNSDLVISIGARLGTRETGSPLSSFARKAKFVVVDIDKHELSKFSKFGKSTDIQFNLDVNEFLKIFSKKLKRYTPKKYTEWENKIQFWKQNYPSGGSFNSKKVNPYLFYNKLTNFLSSNEIIFTDTGSTIAWASQAINFNGKIRLIHDFNNTAMGYALPASIGALFTDKTKNVTCIAGDGSFMMNIQELSTVSEYNLPLKIIVINNEGYSMVKQTQEQWLGGKHYATSKGKGLSFPNFKNISKAFNLDYVKIANNFQLRKLENLKKIKKPILIEILVDERERVIPQSRFGYPIEDSDPLLPRKEFKETMIIETIS
jgi:acetolactate synthase-1/2/3 large subunit